MDDNRANVIGMGFERRNTFRCVVVIDSNLEVIGAADDPILAGNKTTGAYGNIGKLKGLDNLLRLVRPNLNVTCEGLLDAWSLVTGLQI